MLKCNTISGLKGVISSQHISSFMGCIPLLKLQRLTVVKTFFFFFWVIWANGKPECYGGFMNFKLKQK